MIGLDPLCGHVFVFMNRRRNRVKLLTWGPTGYTLIYRRLENGTFTLPTRTADARMRAGKGQDRPGREPRARVRPRPLRRARVPPKEVGLPELQPAPGPTKVIDRSGDGASVLAHAVVSKYADHTPCTDFQSIVAPGHLQKPPIDAPRDAVCM